MITLETLWNFEFMQNKILSKKISFTKLTPVVSIIKTQHSLSVMITIPVLK